MFDQQNIKPAAERNQKAVALKPSSNRGTEPAKAQLTDGFRFDIDIDGIKIETDDPHKYGGNAGMLTAQRTTGQWKT